MILISSYEKMCEYIIGSLVPHVALRCFCMLHAHFEFNEWDLFAYSEYLSNLIQVAVRTIATTSHTHAKHVACGDLCCMDRVNQGTNTGINPYLCNGSSWVNLPNQ